MSQPNTRPRWPRLFRGLRGLVFARVGGRRARDKTLIPGTAISETWYKAALRYKGRSWTYAAFEAWVAAEAEALAARGVGVGDRVAVLALNHPRTLVLLFACDRLGAMLCPLNWRLAAAELAWILEDAAPLVLFVDGVGPALTRPGMEVLEIDGVWGGDVPIGGGPLILSRAERGLLLVYTSGTTGRPKGAVLSAAALVANAVLSWDMHGLTAEDHVLTVLPLFHVGGLNIQTVPALLAGATVTLHARFEPGAALEAVAQDRPTLTVLVPAMLQAVTGHPGWKAADLSSLRAVATGSTVVQPAVTAPFVARGLPVLQVYGSTETAPIAIYTRAGAAYAAESTGHAGPGCAAVAMDDAGEEVGTGVAGEIWLRGPQLFREYWRNAAATAEAFRDGWFRTGDIGTQREDGAWVVHDRKKNLIVSGGENIYPAEIERVLHEMPEVAEAAVVGAPDARWQEVPEAYVVLQPGAACGEAEVIAHVHAQLARFKAPRRVHFVAGLPRNAMGKVQHALLRGPA